jgi:hypothetical protein
MAHVPIPPAAERRIRREARSAALRERALALRQAGWTFTSIGIALGVSTTRALQIVRKAERLIAQRVTERDASPENEEGAPATERPSDCNSPLVPGHNDEQKRWYPPTTT